MDQIFAEFRRSPSNPSFVRVDTRFYLKPHVKEPKTATCVGAVIMCNPAGLVKTGPPSAPVARGALVCDPTMGRLRKMFDLAMTMRPPRVGIQSENPEYVAIHNLFYTAHSKIPAAYAAYIGPPVCTYTETVSPTARFVLLAWGCSKALTPTKFTSLSTNAAASLSALPKGIPVINSLLPSTLHSGAFPHRTAHPLGSLFDIPAVATLIAPYL